MRIDTHLHTTESDGRGTPYQVVRWAAKKGLDGIVVTDHDTFRGAILAERARRIQGLDGFVVVYGNEVRTVYDDGGSSKRADVVVACPKPVEGVPRDLFELRDVARENNCALIAVHPFSCFEPALGRILYKHPGLFDLVEVWNATTPLLANLRAIRAASRLGKPGVAGSDAHVPREIGSAYTIVDAGAADPDSIVEAFLAGRTKPVYGVPGIRALLERIAWGIERRL